MTNKEMEDEIQARIEFKFEELLTGLKNRVKFKYGQMFDMTHKSQYIWEAFEEVAGMAKKELYMAPPCDEMANRRKRQAKDEAVKKIVDRFNLVGREYQEKISTIVNAIEHGQNW